MSASELFAKIARSGILDAKTLERLRSQVEDSTKNVKPRAIVKYLLTKGFIDQQQSDDLLAGKDLVPHLMVDEQFDEVAPSKKDYDTDDLTAVVGHMSDPPAAPEQEPEEEIAELDADDEVVDLPLPASRPARETRMMDSEDLDDPEPVEPPKSRKKSGSESKKRKRERERGKASAPADEGFGAFDEPAAESFAGATMDGPKKVFTGKLDTSDQWNTRWLWTGFAVLAALLVAVGVLWLGVLRVDADKLFAEAEQSFASGAMGDAAELFKEFAERFPNHDKASLAKVRSVNALIRFSYNTNDFRTAYRVANENLPGVVEEPAMNDELRPDLGVMLPKIAHWFSELPLKEKEVAKVEERLTEAKQVFKDLIETRTYLTAINRNGPRATELISGAENNILTADGILKKEEDYTAVSAKIRTLTEQGKTDQAFEEFTRIVRTYPDLGARQELRETMAAVSTREIGLVTESNIAIEVTEGPQPSPVTVQILTDSTVGTTIEAMVGEVVPVLAEGAVYGVNAGTGKLLWRHFVGLSTSIQPQWTNEDNRTSLIVCDQDQNLVSRLDANSGQVVWTARIGEAVLSPKITADGLFVATREGTIIKLDIANGTKMAGAKLPRQAAVSCEVAEQSSALFVAGEDSNLYVLNSQTLACDYVYYAGHAPGSIRIAPIFWSGFLLVVVNDSESSNLLVLKKNDEDGSWERIQRVRLARGSVSAEPSRLGRYMLFTSDNGEIHIMDLNPAEPESPIREFAAGTFDRRDANIWSNASGSNLWIAGRGLVSFRIQRAAGQLETGKVPVIDGTDTFLGPITKKDEVLFTLRRRSGAQMVSVAAVNAETMQPIWRTDFAGKPAGQPYVSANGLSMVTAQGNLLQIGPEEIQAGSSRVLARSSDIDEVFAFSRQVVFDDGSSSSMGPSGFPYLLAADAAQNSAALRRLQAPAEQPACDPISLGQDLIVPTRNGYLVRIDSKTGSYAGSPYQPPLTPGSVVEWNRPAKLDATSFVIGNGTNKVMLIDGADRGSLKLASEIELTGQVRSAIVAVGQSAYFVEQTATGSQLVRTTANGSKLELNGTVDLAGLKTQDPLVAADLILVSTEDGELTAFDESLAKKWSYTTNGDRIISAIANGPQLIMICFEKGQVLEISVAGEVQKTLELGQPVSQPPVLVGNQLIFAAGDGTLLVVDGAGN